MAKKLTVNDFFVYRWRYILGYSAVIAILVGLLVFAGLFVPGGLTTQEMASVVVSDQINTHNLSSIFIINLPYHLLQLASIHFFGITVLSVKLPSLIIGMVSAVGLIFLLRRWFKYNVAVLAAIIAFSTGQFLFISQNGTSIVMYIFWSTWLLLAATMAARHNETARVWRYVFFFLAALSLYTPLSIYVILTIVSAVLLHPHLRYLFRKLPTLDIVLAAIIGVLIASPLIYQIILNPDLGLTLLGAPETWPNLMENIVQLFNRYLGFANPTSKNGIMLPLFGLGSLLLVAVGAVAMFKTRYTVKSYIVIIWTLLLVPVVVLNPDVDGITFVPSVLLLATGTNYLFRKWYGLFPRNPYARVAGLLPLVALVSVLVISGIGRYAYGYHYSPGLANSFSKDITYIQTLLRDTKYPVTLVVPANEIAFYQTVADRIGPGITVSNKLNNTKASTVIVAGAVHGRAPAGMQLDNIVTNSRSDNADRLYVYKNSTK